MVFQERPEVDPVEAETEEERGHGKVLEFMIWCAVHQQYEVWIDDKLVGTVSPEVDARDRREFMRTIVQRILDGYSFKGLAPGNSTGPRGSF